MLPNIVLPQSLYGITSITYEKCLAQSFIRSKHSLSSLCHCYIERDMYSDAGRDWGQEEKGTTEDEMAGWHH